jgi:AcrR family transcriptional regulator
MSAKPKTSTQDILAAARDLVERHGAAHLSMHDIAAAVGIKAPSLYKHFAGRAPLLCLVRDLSLSSLTRELRQASAMQTAPDALVRMARAYRLYAQRNPNIYRLFFDPELRPAADLDHYASSVFAGQFKRLDLPEALACGRAFVAFLHGFVMLELAGNISSGKAAELSFEIALIAFIGGRIGSDQPVADLPVASFAAVR